MREKERYIGVFDSGIGGLTVVKALLNKMPNENIIFLADSKHMPYGDKTNKEILQYVKEDLEFLNKYELKSIVIACNTIDSVASKQIQKASNVPVYGVIDATANYSARSSKNNRIGVIATTATINSNKYQELIKRYNPSAKVFAKACPFLAPLIEDGKFDIGNQEMRYILEDYISPLLEENIDTLVLGCTHYDLLLDIINDMYPELNIVSSSRCVINTLKKNVEANDNIHNEQLYFSTSDNIKFQEIASMFMGDIIVREK